MGILRGHSKSIEHRSRLATGCQNGNCIRVKRHSRYLTVSWLSPNFFTVWLRIVVPELCRRGESIEWLH